MVFFRQSRRQAGAVIYKTTPDDMTFGIRKATRPAANIIFALVVIAIVAPRLIAVIVVPIVVSTATTIVVAVDTTIGTTMTAISLGATIAMTTRAKIMLAAGRVAFRIPNVISSGVVL